MLVRSVLFCLLALTTPIQGRRGRGTGRRGRGRDRNFKITVRNITPGQPMSPFFIAVHNSESPPFWMLSRPVNSENGLTELAENGDVSVMESFYEPLDSTYETHVLTNNQGPGTGMPPDALLFAGEESSVTITVPADFPYVSMASMAVNTNDCFVGFAGRKLDGGSFTTPGYDAGTEGNDEVCGNIPGPACGGGTGRNEADAEGYVVVHNGVHGIADLQANLYDWNNNMLLVLVEEV